MSPRKLPHFRRSYKQNVVRFVIKKNGNQIYDFQVICFLPCHQKFPDFEKGNLQSGSKHPMSPKNHLVELLGGADVLNLKTLAGAFVITALATILYRAFLHPLAGVPGPRLASITGLWRTYRYARGTWHDDVLEVHTKYGPVVRIAPNEVSIVDAGVAKRLFGHGKNAPKTTWYNTWKIRGNGPSLFAELDSKHHSALRKRV